MQVNAGHVRETLTVPTIPAALLLEPYLLLQDIVLLHLRLARLGIEAALPVKQCSCCF